MPFEGCRNSQVFQHTKRSHGLVQTRGDTGILPFHEPGGFSGVPISPDTTIVWVHGTAARLMLLWLIRMFVPRWDMGQIVFPIILFYNILYHMTSMNMLNSTSRFKRMAFGLVAFFLTHTPCQIMQAEFDRGVHSIVTSDAYKTTDLGSGWCCGHSRSREGHWA